MSRREALLSAGLIFGLALAVRTVAAAVVGFPVPEDTAYYAGVARNLVEGRGLVSDALWSYQTQPLTVPRAAFEVWMPLPSLVAALPMAVLGAANWFRAAQVVSVALGSILALLAWRLGADVAAEMRLPLGRARTMAVGTGVVAGLLGPLVVYSALPDSTGLFAVLSLAACLLMARIAAKYSSPGPRRGRDRRLVSLGVLLGLAAMTRSEAIWLGLAWLLIVWRGLPRFAGTAVSGDEPAHANVSADTQGGSAEPARFPGPEASSPGRLRMALIPTIVAALVFAPWAVRDWLAFGTPLPGQAIGNSLYTNSHDIFAYSDPPSLARYLAQGPAAILDQHLAGIAHDLLAVLVIPAFPLGLIGLLALPLTWRLHSLRPLVLVAALTFIVTSLVFPVSTQSGTFLHAAGSIFVLLIVSTLAALDALIAAVGRRRRWTRPVAWLGPAFAIAAIAPLAAVSVGAVSQQAGDVAATYDALPAAMARAGTPLVGSGPIITNFPIWLAESARVQTLALPEESPASVLSLARRFGAHLLVVRDDDGSEWPSILTGAGASDCFREAPLADTSTVEPQESSPLAKIHVYRIVCP
jgi:hypothetical protein